MTEYEALSQMLLSMMNYMGITEESEKKKFDEGTIKDVKTLLDTMPKPLAESIAKAFKDTFQEDYKKLLLITLSAILESLDEVRKKIKGEEHDN